MCNVYAQASDTPPTDVRPEFTLVTYADIGDARVEKHSVSPILRGIYRDNVLHSFSESAFNRLTLKALRSCYRRLF